MIKCDTLYKYDTFPLALSHEALCFTSPFNFGVLLLLLHQGVGNMAIQDFYQRTLSSSSTSVARRVCFIAAGVVLFAGIPSTLIGAVAASMGDQLQVSDSIMTIWMMMYFFSPVVILGCPL